MTRPVTSRRRLVFPPEAGPPGHPQALELAVAADGGEADPVVELADLVQRGAGVLGDEEHAVGVGDDGDAATAGDALAGVLRLVAHQLLGRGVVRHGHGDQPCPSAAARSSVMIVATAATSSSVSRTAPSASTR